VNKKDLAKIEMICMNKCDNCPAKEKCKPDLKRAGKEWFYSPEVKKHFFHPENLATSEPRDFDGVGEVGSPACGDVMKLWVWIRGGKIVKCKWQTFGCASAIASTSMLSVMVTEKGGMKIDRALKLTPKDILKRLGGLPNIKIHCSVLGDQALRAAIKNYQERKSIALL
jgi:NifU-like protein involved in Fe-S cluster formation